MVERFANWTINQVIAACAVGTFLVAVLGGGAGYLVNAIGAFNHSDLQVQHVGDKVDYLASQVKDEKDAFLRMEGIVSSLATKEQLQEIQRHLSAQDGRMDAMDRRSGDLENRETRTEVRLDGYDAAGRDLLPAGHRTPGH